MPTANFIPFTSGTNVAQVSYYSGVQTSWNAARSATTAASYANSGSGNKDAATYYLGAGRTQNYAIGRIQTWFDLSSLSTTTITAMDLKIKSGTSSGASISVVAVASNAFGNLTNATITTADYNNLNPSTTFSSAVSWPNAASAGSTVIFSMNAAAISVANTTNKFGCALITSAWDQPNTDPTGGFSFDLWGAVDWKYRFDLLVTYTSSSGYAHNVNAVVPASIGNINGVATGDIGSMNGV